MTADSARPRRLALVDRDGVLNHDVGYAHRPDQLRLTAGAGRAVRRLNEARVIVCVITNQSGVARGLFDEVAVEAFHAALEAALAREGGRIDAIDYCPFHPDAMTATYRHPDHPDRKPNPGMIFRALNRFSIAPEAAFLIGDQQSDLEAARRAGVRGYLFEGGDLGAFVEAVLRREEAISPDPTAP